MKVSEALIEKYHLGQTSPEETALVETWLADGDEPVADFSSVLPMAKIKSAIWEDIAPHLDDHRLISWKVAAKYAGLAAAAAILILFGVYSFNTVNDSLSHHVQTASNLPESGISDPLAIEFGNESGASYNKQNQKLNFCGVIKITPKENMKLSFSSFCNGKKEIVREVDVKGGTTYFAMDVRQDNDAQVIVMDKNLIDELPPILQNSLIAQFGI